MITLTKKDFFFLSIVWFIFSLSAGYWLAQALD